MSYRNLEMRFGVCVYAVAEALNIDEARDRVYVWKTRGPGRDLRIPAPEFQEWAEEENAERKQFRAPQQDKRGGFQEGMSNLQMSHIKE